MRPLQHRVYEGDDRHLNEIFFRLRLYGDVLLPEVHENSARLCRRVLPEPLWSWPPKMACAR